MGWKDYEKEHGGLKSTRAREETVWRDLARILRPDDQNFDVSSKKDRDGSETFDSTPLYAQDDFVGGMFGTAMNPADRWFGLALADKDLMKFAPVKQWLWDVTDVIADSLKPAVSTFYLEAPAWIADLAGFGTGHLWQEEWVARRRIVERALPIGECFRAVDAAGDTNRFHREFMLTEQQAKGWFGDRAPVMRDGEEAKFVHVVHENSNYRPAALGQRFMFYRSCYVSPDKQDFQVEGGYNELPVHVIEWSKRSGRTWATGPGHNALADMRMLDEKQRSTLTAIQFEAEPMFAVADEDVMTAADIYPSSVIFGGMSSSGKKLVEAIKRGENPQVPMASVEQTKNDIRSAFYFGLMQIVKNRPQMTAAEFLGWKQENLKLLAPHLVRIHRGLGSFIARRYGILSRDQRLPPAPPELQNAGALSVVFDSPFEKAQKADKAQSTLQWFSALGQFATEAQRPDILDNADIDAGARVLHDAYGVDPELLVDPRQVAQIRQQRAEQQSQDAQLQRGAVAADIFANVSHAQQAQTLAKGRGKAA